MSAVASASLEQQQVTGGITGIEGVSSSSSSNTTPLPLPHIAVITPTSPSIIHQQQQLRRTHSTAGLSDSEGEQDTDHHQDDNISSGAVSQLPISAHTSTTTATSLSPPHQGQRRVKRRRHRSTHHSSHSIKTASASSSSSTMHSGSSLNGSSCNDLAGDNPHTKLPPSNGHHRQYHNDNTVINPTPSTSRGQMIYPGSQIQREELVRLTLQCLQDAGYQ